jgi:hypothetical protein
MKAKTIYERTQVNDILVMIVDEKKKKEKETSNLISYMSLTLIDEHNTPTLYHQRLAGSVA